MARHTPGEPTRLEQITQALSASPALSTIGIVLVVSLILNALFLGVAILRQPILFVWMELLGALALGGVVYLILRINQLAAARRPSAQDIDYLNALKAILGVNEYEIESRLNALKAPSIEFDDTDRGVLDGIRNTMSAEEFERFLLELLAQYETNVRRFERNPNPRLRPHGGWTSRPRPRRPIDPTP